LELTPLAASTAMVSSTFLSLPFLPAPVLEQASYEPQLRRRQPSSPADIRRRPIYHPVMLSGEKQLRLGWLIDRLNRQALWLTRPGPRWLLKAVLIGLSMKAASVLIAISLKLLFAIATGALDTPDEALPTVDVVKGVVTGLLLAPTIETLEIVLLFWLLRPRLGIGAFVLCSSVLAGLEHISGESWFRPDAILQFAVMSYQYASFREHVGKGRAYWGVALAHATSNGMALAAALAVESGYSSRGG